VNCQLQKRIALGRSSVEGNGFGDIDPCNEQALLWSDETMDGRTVLRFQFHPLKKSFAFLNLSQPATRT
jgi:hypothetical protein